MPSYPTDTHAGIGLAAFELLPHIQQPTLVITKKRDGVPVKPPPHVRLVRVPYVESTLSDNRGLGRLFRLMVKAIGYLTFFLLSIPQMVLFRPNVIHVHTPMPILHGLFAKYVLRSKFYLSFHGSDVDALARSPLLRVLAGKADVLCVVADQMKDDLLRLLPSATVLYTPNGVVVDQFPTGTGKRSPVVCMVGNLKWQKDYPTAIRAFSEFLRTFPDWRMQIIGEGPNREDAEKAIDSLGLRQSVELRGVRSRAEVAEAMRSCRIFMMSSLTEGFPKVLLEAGSSGTPTVTTDVGNAREIVGEGGFGIVVEPGSAAQLTDALLRIANDDELWEKFAQQGPVAARRYTWEATGRLLLESYASN